MTNKDIIENAQMRIFNYSVGDLLRSIEGSALVGAYIQTFCLIDYCAQIELISKKSQGKSYKGFISKYFPEEYKEEYMPERIFAIRCALIHTYGTSEAMQKAKMRGYILQHKNPENHLRFKESILNLNLSDFVFDTIKSIYLYFEAIKRKEDDEIFDEAERAKDILTVFKNSESITLKNYGQINPVLIPLDFDPVNWEELRNNIYQMVLNK
jgi:hypothetical protein